MRPTRASGRKQMPCGFKGRNQGGLLGGGDIDARIFHPLDNKVKIDHKLHFTQWAAWGKRTTLKLHCQFGEILKSHVVSFLKEHGFSH